MKCPQCSVENVEGMQACGACGSGLVLSQPVTVVQQPATAAAPVQRRSSKKKTLGIILICAPFAGLVLILLAWAVVIFIVGTGSRFDSTSLNIIQWLLGFLGLIFVLAIPVGLVVGIILIVKKGPQVTAMAYDQRSGRGEDSVIPDEIVGWNWGAAGLTFIWGITYNVWLSLLSFVPVLGFFWWIVLGIKGNEWAWEQTQWQSVVHFQQTQRKWMSWGIAALVLSFIATLLPFLFFVFVLFN